MADYVLKIVGMHFRPPAKALVNMTVGGTTVWLRKEPENQFDPNAIAVWLDSSSIPEDQFEEQAEVLAGFGHDRDSVLAQPQWHLAYIPAKDASWLVRKLSDGADTAAELHFDHDGKPIVRFSVADTTSA